MSNYEEYEDEGTMYLDIYREAVSSTRGSFTIESSAENRDEIFFSMSSEVGESYNYLTTEQTVQLYDNLKKTLERYGVLNSDLEEGILIEPESGPELNNSQVEIGGVVFDFDIRD